MTPHRQELLESIGWKPGRDIGKQADQWVAQLATEGGFVLFPAAERAIREFGGLKSAITARGVTVAREPFDLDPTLAAFQSDELKESEGQLGQRLYPLGEGGGGHYVLAIAEDGRVFFLGPWIVLAGGDIAEAIANLIEGRTGQRLAQP